MILLIHLLRKIAKLQQCNSPPRPSQACVPWKTSNRVTTYLITRRQQHVIMVGLGNLCRRTSIHTLTNNRTLMMLCMDYNPWTIVHDLKGNFGHFSKGAKSQKPERPCPLKLVCMHFGLTSTCMNFLSRFYFLTSMDYHGPKRKFGRF